MPLMIAPIEEIPTHREFGLETGRKLDVGDNTHRIPLKFHTKLLLLFNSCFGVMTYDEDLIQNHLNNLPFKYYCKCSQIISSILITTYGAKLYQSTGEIYTMEDNPSIVGIAVSYFRIISIINFLVTSSLKSLERWQEYVEVLEKIKQLNTRLDVKFVRLRQRGSIIMIGIYVMTNGIHKLFSMLKKPDEFFLIPIGNMMVFILIIFELNLRKLVLHLCTMFDAINTSLEHFGKERFINYNHNVYSHLGVMIVSTWCGSSSDSDSDPNQDETIVTTNSDFREQAARRTAQGKYRQTLTITQLSDLHRELCGVIQDVSNAFGGQNISLMFFLVFYITFCPYKIFICFLKPTEDWEYMENIVILVCWCITYIGMLFILILPCSSATSKANKTATIVSEILTMKNMSPHNYSEMEKFSRQLLHHSTQFTVMDMFTLNLSLITTIAGSVTTYLVILIQFEDTFF